MNTPYAPDPTPAAAAPKKPRTPWLIAAALAALGVAAITTTAVAAGDTNRPTAAPAATWDAGQSQPRVAGSSATPTPEPTTASPTPEATTEPAEAEPAEPPAKAAKLSARQWKKIAKSPDDYIGKKYVVYGVVTQFDSATGGDMFRADIGPKNMSEAYDYDTNSMVSVIDLSMVGDLVEDDEFRAEMVVMGSQSYETAMGGEMTVPWLMVTAVKVI